MIFGKGKSHSAAPQRKEADVAVPPGMLVAGAWSWRILVIVGVIAVFIFLVMQLRIIVIPLMVAVLLSALLVPLAQMLMRRRWPRWLATTTTAVAVLGIVVGLIWLVVWQVRMGLPELQAQSLVAWEGFKQLLLDSPLHLTDEQISEYGKEIWESVQQDRSVWVSGALSVGSSAGAFVGTFVAGLFLVIFSTIIMLVDGKGIWSWVVRLFPRRARPAVHGSGLAGWGTLTSFVKVQIFVAAIDAVGIGLGAFFLQLPLVIPIAVAVFLGSFVPIIGAVVTGALAVFIALIYKNVLAAIIMLIIVLGVQQVESHLLQPLIMGNAVKVHPIAVVLAVAAGSYVAGIPGALFAVPVVATLNSMVSYIAGGRWREPGAVDGSAWLRAEGAR